MRRVEMRVCVADVVDVGGRAEVAVAGGEVSACRENACAMVIALRRGREDAPSSDIDVPCLLFCDLDDCRER